MKLFLKISNRCDHDTSTLRTDRRLAVAIKRSVIASRGKKFREFLVLTVIVQENFVVKKVRPKMTRTSINFASDLKLYFFHV